jgi:aryl-alcohol dehydrogenase-like predicted oxidoreductase
MPAGFPGSRTLGRSGIEVSRLSLGSWRTYERLPPEAGVAILRAARDEGINFFDDARYDDETGTAPMRTGYSEVLFGELFRGAGLHRDQAVVTNKLWWEFWPEQSAAAELDASLQRMRFDHVDVIYANAPPPGLAVADLVAATAGLVTSGKARAWGLVNWPADLAVQAVEAAAGLGVMPPCAVQLPYCLVRRSWVEDPVMTRALETSGAGLIASFCLAGGVLTGKYLAGQAAGRAAGTLDEPPVARAVAAAGELAALAGQLDTTAVALALAFPFTHPALASVLFGATSPEQVRADCAVIGLLERLSPADLAQLRRIGRPEDPAPQAPAAGDPATGDPG